MTENIALPKRKIIRRQTNDGWIVEIPISDDPNGAKVTLLNSDWEELARLGVYPILTVEKAGYVMVWCPKYRIYKRLARLIVNAYTGQKVSTKDGNELNLLRWNISAEPMEYDRAFLSTDDCQYYNDLVEYETDWGMDPMIEARVKLMQKALKENK